MLDVLYKIWRFIIDASIMIFKIDLIILGIGVSLIFLGIIINDVADKVGKHDDKNDKTK